MKHKTAVIVAIMVTTLPAHANSRTGVPAPPETIRAGTFLENIQKSAPWILSDDATFNPNSTYTLVPGRTEGYNRQFKAERKPFRIDLEIGRASCRERVCSTV